ncbi:MAG: IspD/TarI family cytidylyltransferase [Phycisphaerae bacterium]
MRIGVLFVLAAPAWAAKDSGQPFSKIDGREIFMRTIELYANRDQAQQRILCVLPDDLERVQQKYGAHLAFQGVGVAVGGPDWFGATQRGCEKLKPEIDTIIVHDACCPAVPYTVLDALEEAVGKTGAAVPVVPVGGALVRTKNDTLESWISNSGMQLIQSPQIFSRSVLAQAYGRRTDLGVKYSDDAGLVKLTGTDVLTVPGWRLNIRIDHEELIKLGSDAIKHLPRARINTPVSPFDEAQW